MRKVRSRLSSRQMVGAMVWVALLGTFSGAAGCSAEGYSGPMETISLGTVLLEPSVLIFIAEAQGFFPQNGLEVDITYFENGRASANAMLEGEVDIAGPVTEYVLVNWVFSGADIQTFGGIDKVDYASIVARRDHGIEEIPDLQGKKIGVTSGTILEFGLGRFLELHGFHSGEVEIVEVSFAESPGALARGEIDAVMIVPPYTDQATKALGEQAVVWPGQSGQLSYQLLVSKTDWIRQHPELIERFLTAINQAESYLINHPEEARAIVQHKMDVTGEEIQRIWSQNQFSLSLDQSLILAMEDEARWMMQQRLTSEKVMPDFIHSIYIEGLEAVKPEAINIIR